MSGWGGRMSRHRTKTKALYCPRHDSTQTKVLQHVCLITTGDGPNGDGPGKSAHETKDKETKGKPGQLPLSVMCCWSLPSFSLSVFLCVRSAAMESAPKIESHTAHNSKIQNGDSVGRKGGRWAITLHTPGSIHTPFSLFIFCCVCPSFQNSLEQLGPKAKKT